MNCRCSWWNLLNIAVLNRFDCPSFNFFSNTHLHSGEESLKTKRTITSHLMAYGVENQSPGLKQAQKCGGGMEKFVI